MKRALGLSLLGVAAIPVAFFMRVWLDVNGLEPTEAFASVQSFFLFLQLASFFAGSVLYFCGIDCSKT